MKLHLNSTLLPRLLGRPFLAGTLAALVALHCAHAAEEAANFISMPVGKEFTIELEANPTTGYQWQLLKPLDCKILEVVGNRYVADAQPAGREPLVGAGGKELWTFKVLRRA